MLRYRTPQGLTAKRLHALAAPAAAHRNPCFSWPAYAWRAAAEGRTWRRDTRLAAGVAHQTAPRAAKQTWQGAHAQKAQSPSQRQQQRWGTTAAGPASMNERCSWANRKACTGAAAGPISKNKNARKAALPLTSSRRRGCSCRPAPCTGCSGRCGHARQGSLLERGAGHANAVGVHTCMHECLSCWPGANAAFMVFCTICHSEPKGPRHAPPLQPPQTLPLPPPGSTPTLQAHLTGERNQVVNTDVSSRR